MEEIKKLVGLLIQHRKGLLLMVMLLIPFGLYFAVQAGMQILVMSLLGALCACMLVIIRSG